MRPLYAILVMLSCILTLAGTTTAAPIQWTTALGGNDHWYEAVVVGGNIE